jgi:protein-S-isoprenylcysteine O-methyltransferase Ste14
MLPVIADDAETHRTSPLIRIGQFFFKFRDFLFPVVLLPVAIGTRPRVFADDPRIELVMDAIGILVALSGQALRAVVIGLAYIQRGGKNKQIYASNLVREGIFAHSRNPLYVGNLLIVTGLVLIHNGVWMYAFVLPFFFLVYISIVAAEEQYLRGHFGAEYDEYCRSVPRFLPRLSGIGATLRSMTFDWKRLVRKEYGTFFSTITAILGLLVWQRITSVGYPAANVEIRAIGVLWIVCILAYVTARVLKKSGSLGHG